MPFRLTDGLQEILMKSQIIIQLRMKREGKLPSLSGGNDMPIDSGQRLTVG